MKLNSKTIVLFILSLSFCGCSSKKNSGASKPHSPKHKKATPSVYPNPKIAFCKDGILTLNTPNGSPLAILDYEQATTPEKRAIGLMYRTTLEENQGMLFIFEDMAPRYMYMKNTLIPLDILFFDDEKKVIKIHHNAQPRSTELLPSIKNARYALEVNAGFCTKNGITEGFVLNF